MASSDADEAHVSKAQGEGAAPIKAAALSRQVDCVAFESNEPGRESQCQSSGVKTKEVQWTSKNGSSGP